MTIPLSFINSMRTMAGLAPIVPHFDPYYNVPEPGITRREMRLARRDIFLDTHPIKPRKPRQQKRGGDGLTKRERGGLHRDQAYIAHSDSGRLIVVSWPPGKTVVGSSGTGPIRNAPCPCGSGRKVKNCVHVASEPQAP